MNFSEEAINRFDLLINFLISSLALVARQLTLFISPSPPSLIAIQASARERQTHDSAVHHDWKLRAAYPRQLAHVMRPSGRQSHHKLAASCHQIKKMSSRTANMQSQILFCSSPIGQQAQQYLVCPTGSNLGVFQLQLCPVHSILLTWWGQFCFGLSRPFHLFVISHSRGWSGEGGCWLKHC